MVSNEAIFLDVVIDHTGEKNVTSNTIDFYLEQLINCRSQHGGMKCRNWRSETAKNQREFLKGYPEKLFAMNVIRF